MRDNRNLANLNMLEEYKSSKNKIDGEEGNKQPQKPGAKEKFRLICKKLNKATTDNDFYVEEDLFSVKGSDELCVRELWAGEEMEHDQPDGDKEENSEIAKLQNLTPVQIQKLQEENEQEIDAIKDKIALIRKELEGLEKQECATLRSQQLEDDIIQKRVMLQEEKIYLQQLEERTCMLKNVKTKYQPFPIEKLPQVILCAPWDNLMPQVVVCRTPRNEENNKKVHEVFLKHLNLEQLKMLEEERRWMNLESSRLQILLADVKGKIRIINQENDVLRAIVLKENSQEEILTVAIPGKTNMKKHPCNKLGKLGETIVCPRYKIKDNMEVPPMIIQVSSSAQDVNEMDEWISGNIVEELSYLENKVGKLQNDLEKAKERLGTLLAQQNALNCMKETLKIKDN